MNKIFATLLAVSALHNLPAIAKADTVRIGFVERAGYAYTEQGTPKGLLVDVATKILSKAKLDFSLEALPQQRLVNTIKEGGEPLCALGLFKNPERESYAVFTKAIYKNQPLGTLVQTSKSAEFSKFQTLADLVNAPNLTLGLVSGFSYGSFVDDLVSKMNGKKYSSSVTPALMVGLLGLGRIDYMFVDPEEYLALAEAAKIDKKDVAILHFKDVPEGNQRYLMCSRAVPPDAIAKINAAIEP